MTCSESTTPVGRRRPGVQRRHTLPVAMVVVGLLASVGAAAAPAIQTDFLDNDVLAELPVTRSARATAASEPQLTQAVRQNLQLAQRHGDPRYLGYARRLLADWPEQDLGPEPRLLRARLRQSLHEFDAARADLEFVRAHSDSPSLNRQAILLQATMALAQGHYPEAGQACRALLQQRADLMAYSCQALVEGRAGNPESAYRSLRQILRQSRASNAQQLGWTLGSLGELADLLELDDARRHWQTALLMTPDDLYVRTQLADWHLRQGEPEHTLELTEGYAQVDSLAVLRAIALKRTGHRPQAEALAAHLNERFAEALWRGDMLHRREYARFLLDVSNRPEQALTQARLNWQDQREPADTRLLLRAARAAGDPQASAQAHQWLASTRSTGTAPASGGTD